MKNIYLANINGTRNVFLPYSCGLIDAYCNTDNVISSNYIFCDYIFDNRKTVNDHLLDIDTPDIIGLSCYTWNFRKSLKLAKLIKKKYPNCIVVLGGPNVPDDISTITADIREYADILIHKEGEETFKELLLELLKEDPKFENIKGISYKKDGNFFKNANREKFDLSKYVSPFLEGKFDKIIESLKERNLPIIAIWETNRGCPYSCTFCDWGSYTQQKLRLIPWEIIIKEIAWFGQHVDEIHVCDANFGIHPRDVEISRLIVDQKNKHNKLKYFHAAYAKNNKDRVFEISKILNDNNLILLGSALALQSTDPVTLAAIKRDNIKIENYQYLCTKFNENNMITLCDLILPLPGETITSFYKSLEDVLESNVTHLRVFPLFLFPNSEMSNTFTKNFYKFEMLKWPFIMNGIEDETEYYDLVIGTKDFSAEYVAHCRRLSDLIITYHTTKWFWFVATYLKRTHKVRYVDFYNKLLKYSYQQSNDNILKKICMKTYLHNYNHGNENNFVGSHSPFNIKWGDHSFNQWTFLWLCLLEDFDLLWPDFLDFLKSNFTVDEELEDCVAYQKEIIIRPNYNSKIGKFVKTKYAWHEYFWQNKELKNTPQLLHFHDKTIGTNNIILDNINEAVLVEIAGGNNTYQSKNKTFIHQPATTKIISTL